MSVVGIIFAISNLFLVLIFWAINLGVHKPKRGKLFGVNMPEGHMNDERVQEIVSGYLKRDKRWFLIALITAFLPLYPTDYFSITYSFFLIWTTWVIVYKMAIFGKTVKKLRDLKDACGWFDPVRDADEKHWYGGVWYHNPDSKKMFTNQYMMGMGSTVNMATRGGKIFMIAVAIILFVSLVPTWAMIVIDDFVPPKIELSETSFSIRSGFGKVETPYEDIVSISWEEDLKIGTKSNGSGTPIYSRGTFFVGDYGKCYVNRFKAVPEMILVIRENDKPMVFNTVSLEKTQEIYRALLKRINE